MLKVTVKKDALIKAIEKAKAKASVCTEADKKSYGWKKVLTRKEWLAEYADYVKRTEADNKRALEYAARRTVTDHFDRMLRVLALSTDDTLVITERDDYFQYI